MAFKKATLAGRKLRASIQGPSGSGKTRTALRIAQGIVEREGGRIAVICAEDGRCELEAHNHDFDRDLLADKTPEGFVRALHEAEQAGYTVAILDGASEEWKSLLKHKDSLPEKQQYRSWGQLTPRHDDFFTAIRKSPIHVILTFRMRMAHEISKTSDGKTEIKKMGLSPIAREETEYEIDLAFEVDLDLKCWLTKPPRGIFESFHNFNATKPGEDLGHRISDLLRGLPDPKASPDFGAQFDAFVKDYAIGTERVGGIRDWFNAQSNKDTALKQLIAKQEAAKKSAGSEGVTA